MNCTVPKLVVRIAKILEPPPRVRSDGIFWTCGNRQGCQRVAQWVDLWIHIRRWYLQLINSILSKLRFQQRTMHFCRLCSLRYQLLWYLCFSFDKVYFCVLRQSIIQLCRQWSARWLGYQICKTWNSWRSVASHFQVLAGSLLLLFSGPKAANLSKMDVCNQSEHELP